MNLLNFLRALIKDDGFELLDANNKSYIIGRPKKEKPIRLKILDKSLHWKLLINPDLYLGEGYMNGSIVIENGTLTEFLDIALKNIGRQPTNEITNILASRITNLIIFRNSSVPKPSRDESNTSSIINRFVFTEFLTLATSLQVNNNAKSIRIFSPSLKDEYEKASCIGDFTVSLNSSSRVKLI